jgi:hypothetical protein
MKDQVLKLNANFVPIGLGDWQKVLGDIISGSAHPVDVLYAQNEDGSYDKSIVDSFYVIRTWKEWSGLEIRPCDDIVQTAKRAYKMPTIVVCANYKAVHRKKMVGPSAKNIHERDNYTCMYTGKKLSKKELTLDHVLPISRGGKNTWENLVTCHKDLNVWKGNKTPEECGLKLLTKPTRPPNGLKFDYLKPEWKIFAGGKHE